MKVLIAESIAQSGVELLRGAFTVDERTGLTREELLEIIPGYDALIVRSATKADAELIDRGTNLKVIGRAGIGLDNVDVDAATRRGVVVVNAPTSNVVSAAEHTMALLLAQARNIPRADASLRSGAWERGRFGGVELHGKTLVILGLGRIGTLVAQRALAFGMKVVAYDPFVSKQRAGQMGVELVATLEEGLARADFVTLHLPKTSETEHLIGARELALMKPGARIVNASRGGMIDEVALAAAVRDGTIAGAALDVFADEPPAPSLPVFAEPAIVVTPHLGASTEEAQEKAGATIAEQVLLALRGELAQYAVNVDAGREISDTVRPFMPLAEKLGKIFTLLGGGGSQVRIVYAGQIADHDTKVLTLSALRGMLSAVVHEPVTFVNAPLLAAERGFEYSETRSAVARDYVNVVEIAGAEGVAVAGTLVGTRNEERITRVFDFHIEMPPGRVMVFLRYDDRPGVIGAIGTILGERGINIADMRVGRQERGGEALMCLTVDQPVSAPVLQELSDGSGAKSATVVSLD